MLQKVRVKEGQRYEKTSDCPGYRSGWEVRSIVATYKSLPHARLVNLDDPQDIRTIACNTIADGQHFRLIEQPRQSRV